MNPVLPESILLEVCVDSVESAVAAVSGGADRLELCGNLAVGGGVTPSFGLVRCIQKVIDVPLMILIRPRVGDFVYSKDEVEVMLEDIKSFKYHGGIRGFVIGALTEEGSVHTENVKRLVDEILPLEALRDIAEIGGISRILTSGHAPKAPDGLETLEHLFQTRKELVEDDTWGLTIMPGSGINPRTLPTILNTLLPLGLREIHMSGGKWMNGNVAFKRDNMGMAPDSTSEWSVWRTEGAEVRKVRVIADVAWKEFYQIHPPMDA